MARVGWSRISVPCARPQPSIALPRRRGVYSLCPRPRRLRPVGALEDYGSGCWQIFAPAYYETELPPSQQHLAGAFNNTLDALSSVFQLVTTENYPQATSTERCTSGALQRPPAPSHTLPPPSNSTRASLKRHSTLLIPPRLSPSLLISPHLSSSLPIPPHPSLSLPIPSHLFPSPLIPPATTPPSPGPYRPSPNTLQISYPAYARYGAAANLFFISFWYVATFIVMAIVTAVIVDKFWRVSKAQIARETAKERQGLMRAFALLDPSGHGSISMRTWVVFLRHLMPNVTPTEARVRFAMLDTERAGRIGTIDFLQMRQQFDMRLTSIRTPIGNASRRLRTRRLLAPPLGGGTAAAGMNAKGDRPKTGATSAGGRLLTCLDWLTMTPSTRTKANLRTFDVTCVAGQAVLLCLVWPDQPMELVRGMCHASLVLAALSALICLERALSMRGAFILHWSNLSDSLVLMVCLPIYMWIYLSDDNSGPTSHDGGSPFEWAFIPELLLALRFFWLVPLTQRFLPLLLRLAPILAALSVRPMGSNWTLI